MFQKGMKKPTMAKIRIAGGRKNSQQMIMKQLAKELSLDCTFIAFWPSIFATLVCLKLFCRTFIHPSTPKMRLLNRQTITT